jgi:hypothetical protein
MKKAKLFAMSAVMMLAAGATRTSDAVGAGWTCNTTCLDTRGFEYVQVSYGGSANQAYENLSCRQGDTVSGAINCWEDDGPLPEGPPVN